MPDTTPAENNHLSDLRIPDANLPTDFKEGVLDITPEGQGHLRPNFTPGDNDIYISSSQIYRFRLRPGDMVGGQVRAPKENERYFGLLRVETVNGQPADEIKERPVFEELLPVFPDRWVKMETKQEILSTRVIDLIAPIGNGQRGMIVSPPKAGKTWLMKDIIEGVAKNYPDVHLMVVLVGERPEEVTDIGRHLEKVSDGKGEMVASNFDEPPDSQTLAAEIAVERAKRLVEMGRDVFVLVDSITRLARAYNLAIPTSGRTLSGGFDPAALYPVKSLFGAARNIEKGGSLTMIGTCLVDTGSRMDDLIYEEFKGTGNMELHLDRKLADRRVFPAINLQRSGTRKEELLFGEKIYPKIAVMRKMIDLLGAEEQTEIILERLKKTKNNKDFLSQLGK
ncbi:transcription termination factor Rho [Candidatus Shapirobacteria bacterium CG09_land_8_20_14_0_10_38_17]|uniref:Transcription termination factor Rho n=1 Tax=Candidatus Shapirobacteria bacterium CG09_land_8_20_14_0_10_38_17 TaxID=1974884 RepID=A0A2H0WQZ0_9BACT|nr:MAG: transcription termination factor Rho [Candidatus Shapirobacteria bacterium CG09_land_8_20_14_0_10_38_17]